jgi:hypothetical protein
MSNCAICNREFETRDQMKFCSNKCQKENDYLEYINNWKLASKKGEKFIETKNISKHVRRYLGVKYEGKCSFCGWNKIHPITNRVPVEVDHIDGNGENNNESNLRLLCPNCHSLTSNFRNLNKGKGRSWRNKNKIAVTNISNLL